MKDCLQLARLSLNSVSVSPMNDSVLFLLVRLVSFSQVIMVAWYTMFFPYIHPSGVGEQSSTGGKEDPRGKIPYRENSFRLLVNVREEREENLHSVCKQIFTDGVGLEGVNPVRCERMKSNYNKSSLVKVVSGGKEYTLERQA